MTDQARTLRALLAHGRIIAAPGAPDALSARLIARTGFDAVYMTGLGATASRLGAPDQKYLTLTRHAYSPTPVLMSKKVWDGLDLEEQALVQTCATEGRVKQIERSRAAVDEALAELKEHGMEVTELTPEATAHLRELVAPVYEAAIPTVGQENYDLLTAELKKLRGN